MEKEQNLESGELLIKEVIEVRQTENKLSVPAAIVIAGIFIAGAIFLKGNVGSPVNKEDGISISKSTLTPVNKEDRVLGDSNAKITVIMYEDFQCIFCGAIAGLQPNMPLIQSLRQRDPNWAPFMPEIVNNYVKNGNVKLVYRDYAFLGRESIKAAEAARCAQDQGKFWEYHDYLFAHQGDENKGNFSDVNLKSFAKNLNLDTNNFNVCLDSNKYTQVIVDAKIEGDNAGVTGTPKGFILKDGKFVATIDGAEPLSSVKQKIDSLLK